MAGVLGGSGLFLPLLCPRLASSSFVLNCLHGCHPATRPARRRSKRTQMLSRAGYRCQTCGCQDARLDVHHNSYENYGDERPQDLTGLCERCHGLFHRGLEDAS
jgi:hypothetical protein